MEEGTCDIELIDRAVARTMRNKFEMGLFEDPYGSAEEVLTLAASEAYQAEQFELTTIDDIYAARSEETNEMEIRLQTESTVLLKNDDNILPLADGTAIYVTGSDEETAANDAEAMAAYGNVVSTMEEADVVVARIGDTASAETIIGEAQAAGKPVVVAYQASNGSFSSAGVEPNSYIAENSAALLMMTYDCKTDHGSSMGNFFTYTLPSVLADMVFGEKEPEGSLVYEIPRDGDDAQTDWGELAYDTGVDTTTRLYMAATVRQDPTALLPNNLGDVLYPADFGMRYGEDSDINLNTLVMDQEVTTTEQENSWTGEMEEVSVAANKTVASGETFQIYMIADNAGADGTILAQAYEGDTLLASQIVSVEGESFSIVTMDITLEGAGEHVITVGDNTLTVTVA